MLTVVSGAYVNAQEKVTTLAREAERLSSSVSELTDRAIRQLSDTSAPFGERMDALRAIRLLKSREAVNSLLNHLLLRNYEVTGPGRLNTYPVALTVADYGSAAYPAVWSALMSRRSYGYLYVLAFTLEAMEGREVAVTRITEKLKEGRLGDEQKNNLSQLLTLLKNVEFDNPEKWPRLPKEGDETSCE